ncbi:MAG: hypothetical protein ACLSG9_03775 [Eubacterium sp.]
MLDTNNKVLSGTVRAKLINATDDDLKSICVAQLGSRYFAGENEPEKESVQNRDNLGKNRRTYFAD